MATPILRLTMKIQVYLFVTTLLCTVPGLLARGTGAPPEACTSMMPNHGVNSQPENIGYYLISDAINSYNPGQQYLVQLRADSDTFRGFFIQARTESNQESTAGIVGVWTPLNTTMTRTATCNGMDGDAVTHSSPVGKRSQFFMWRAPDNNVGRIHFFYSVVQSYRTIFVKLNATEERPVGVIGPPTQPPVDAVFPNSYGQPEDCEQDECEFYVEWRNNGRFVDFRMEGNATGWIALGLSGANTSLNMVGRTFSDILMCQAEPTGSVANVKDMYLAGGSVDPLFDSNVNGTEYTSGRIGNGRIFCNFSRVGFVLMGQENQDVAFNDANFLFFLSGDETGMEADIPENFSISASSVSFSSAAVNSDRLQLGPIEFSGSVNSLRGEGSFPTSGCDPDDCDFYFRWDVNPGNPNFLTFYINADVSRGWAAIGVSPDRRMGGDEIDDVFGCVTVNTNGVSTIAAIDTYNIRGGGRQNFGDGGSDNIVLHEGIVDDGRIKCTFSRVVSVLPGSETLDLNLNSSHYIMIGTGLPDAGSSFPRHDRNPQVSTSEVNLAREFSVDFDYAKIPLIKTHGVLMIVAWPVLAYLGMTMARFMKPALPNGGWFQLHRILVISSLCFTCLGFLLIFVAFRNAPTQGLITLGENNGSGTTHFVFGIVILGLQLANPIIALFRCKPTDENRWIFNIVHGNIIGLGLQILSSINVCIGLYLFGNKYANPEEYATFWLMLAFFIIFAIIDVSFGFYQGIACKLKRDWVTSTVKETEMKPVGEGDTDPPKKSPSPDHLFRWGVWIAAAVLSVMFAIVAIALVGSG
ncbi:putative ferric-chelate reductase 1 [Dysidea avara]|uniref:putative ferric-chelate reductase 1 n=1 Tax=Dysidea avara TaxID=196820 RepID=UPI0033250E72